MIKLEVTYEFTLGRFNELKNVVRKNAEKKKEGWLYIGDTFECEQELADYLTGNNANKLVVAKVLEVKTKEEPKVEEPIKEEQEEVKSTKKKRKRSKYNY